MAVYILFTFVMLVKGVLYCRGDIPFSFPEVGDYSDEIHSYLDFHSTSFPLSSVYRDSRDSDQLERRENKYNFDIPHTYGSPFSDRGNSRKAEKFGSSYSYETTDKPKYFSYSYSRTSKNRDNNGGSNYTPDDDSDATHPVAAVDITDDVKSMRRPEGPVRKVQSLQDVTRKIRPRTSV